MIDGSQAWMNQVQDTVLVSLQTHLEEMPIPYVVELVNLAEVFPAFWEKVLQEGILWQS